MNREVIRLKPWEENGRNYIAIDFRFNASIIRLLKKYGASPSNNSGYWLVPSKPGKLPSLFKVLHKYSWIDYSKLKGYPPIKHAVELKPSFIDAVNQMKLELQREEFSSRSIESHCYCLSHFLSFCGDHPSSSGEYHWSEMPRYLSKWLRRNQPGRKLQKQMVKTLTYYATHVLGQKDLASRLTHYSSAQYTTRCLTPQEVSQLIDAADNLKQKVAIALTYSVGLRLGEMVSLRTKDLDYKQGVVIIKKARGRPKRKGLLPESLIPMLQNYCHAYQPVYWLFEGPVRGHYSARHFNLSIQKLGQKAGITKNINAYMLRTSLALHLLLAGEDPFFIEQLLGYRPANGHSPGKDKIFGPLKNPVDQLKLPTFKKSKSLI